jgi:hypothetical protein
MDTDRYEAEPSRRLATIEDPGYDDPARAHAGTHRITLKNEWRKDSCDRDRARSGNRICR